jgi:hypothetical protein
MLNVVMLNVVGPTSDPACYLRLIVAPWLSITSLCHYGECNCAECRVLFIDMLTVVMLSVVGPSGYPSG